MAILSERIYHAWKEREVYSVVFMDVAGTFNNMHHKRLAHNMRKRRVPEFIVKWAESFLQNRHTRLRFNGVESNRIATDAGVPQGSPISPILYLFYNADLLDIPATSGQSLGFIDDIAFGVQGGTDENNAKELEKMLDEAERWRDAHGARFETSKYVLIHFTRHPNKSTQAAIRIANAVIQPSPDARYLGVVFDKQLRFKQHVQQIAKKGSKFALAISRITKSTWGATYQQTRTLFTTVVAPRMDYAAIIWHRPRKYGQMNRPPQLSKLESAQRTAMKAILGAFRTTATSALEVETCLLPAHLRLSNKILQSFTRMQTTAAKHPIQPCIQQAINSKSQHYVSPLEYIARSFPNYAAEPLETILPYARPPWWTPNFTINVPGNKEAAKRKHENTIYHDDTLYVYTDGSGIDGQVGAAAYSPTTLSTKQQYLGSENQHNIYSAELTAIDIAVNIAQTCQNNYKQCVIYADSQAAIKATVKPGKQSGQSILCSLLSSIDTLISSRGIDLHIEWIPGHKGIKGNETADKAAKEAAQSRGMNATPFKHKSLKTARVNLIKQTIKKEWKEDWKTAKGDAKHLRRITNKTQVNESMMLYTTVNTRYQVAQLARLRTGHCSLNQYLHRFGIVDSLLRTCNSGAIENVEHFLIHCPKYDRQRATLMKKIGIGGMWVEKLLGYSQFVTHTLEYVKSTKRFDF